MAIQSVSRYPSSPAEATEPPRTSRISFSVASILADTKTNQVDEIADSIRYHRTRPESPLRQSPAAQPELPGDTSMSPRPSSQTPPLNLNVSANVASSDDEYEDINQRFDQNSIVDVEDLPHDVHSEDEERPTLKSRLVRPTPTFGAALAAAAYGLAWPGPSPVVPSFGPLFPTHFSVGITGQFFNASTIALVVLSDWYFFCNAIVCFVNYLYAPGSAAYVVKQDYLSQNIPFFIFGI